MGSYRFTLTGAATPELRLSTLQGSLQPLGMASGGWQAAL
jgi:hypothetical protein